MTREQSLALIYKHTHPDFKGDSADYGKSVLMLRGGATSIVPLTQFTDAEIARELPYALRKEARHA